MFAVLVVAVSACVFLLVGALVAQATNNDVFGGVVWVVGTAAMSWWMIAAFRRRARDRRARAETEQLWAEADQRREAHRRLAERHTNQKRAEVSELRLALLEAEAAARFESPISAESERV